MNARHEMLPGLMTSNSHSKRRASAISQTTKKMTRSQDASSAVGRLAKMKSQLKRARRTSKARDSSLAVSLLEAVLRERSKQASRSHGPTMTTTTSMRATATEIGPVNMSKTVIRTSHLAALVVVHVVAMVARVVNDAPCSTSHSATLPCASPTLATKATSCTGSLT